MSTRTKSFFQQDQSSKQRKPGQWHNRPQNRPSLGEQSSNIAPAKPPIPPTSQAKSKLKTFEFHGNSPEGSCADKENETHTAAIDHVLQEQGSAVAKSAQIGSPKRTDAGQLNSEATKVTPQLPHANTFPSTPGASLSIEELIGNCDEIKRTEPKLESPEEQIEWVPNSSCTILTPNRKRKRARSSSPSCPATCSQRNEASAFFDARATPLEKKTPEADPAADLWQRYGAGKDGDDALKLPDISHLVFQASPRPLETPAKSIGLRRWASTGNEWPSSRSKRRRTRGRISINMWQEDVTASTVVYHGGKSKVAAMVEKLQESLATQKMRNPKSKAVAAVDEPSSSSPLPEIGAEGFDGVPTASPLQARQPLIAAQRAGPLQRQTRAHGQTGTIQGQQPGTDYTLEVTTGKPVQEPEPINCAPLHLQSKAPLPAFKRPSISRTSSADSVQAQNAKMPLIALPVVSEELDEFGDDLDLTIEDLEELVSQAPIALPNPQLPRNNPQALQPITSQLPTEPANLSTAAAYDDEIDDADEFGDDELDEDAFAQAELRATQVINNRISPSMLRSLKRATLCQRPTSQPSTDSGDLTDGPQAGSSRPLQRYVTKQVVDGEFTNVNGRRCFEKVVLAEDERSKMLTSITVRGSWTSMALETGNILHVAYRSRHRQRPAADPPGQVIIDDSEYSPLLIVHPDHMLSATTVADSFDCLRKAVLQDRIKATGETNKSMVYGKILHEIFQQALSANHWDEEYLVELVHRTVQAHVEGLWELGMKDNVLAVEEVRTKMRELSSWAAAFVTNEPSEAVSGEDRQGDKVRISISKLIAIEEHVWAPEYGLKGNIDATVQTSVLDGDNTAIKKLIMPFEVKTGKTTQSPAHRAQTALYTLLLSDRYDVDVKAGILYYLESSSMTRIAPPSNEIRQMVQQRNRLASYIYSARHPRQVAREEGQMQPLPPLQTQEIEISGLPELLKNPFKCGRCYAKESCFSYHALVENGSADSAGMVDDGKKNHSQVWQEAVGHLLKSASKDRSRIERLSRWFSKWDKLLTFEEIDLSRLKKELWTMASSEREAAGRCFGNLIVVRDLTSTATAVTSTIVDGIEGGGGRINRFAYTFARDSGQSRNSFAEGSQLSVGEPIVVSSEGGQWALANGYMIAISKHDITVAVDRRLGDARLRLEGFDDESNQAFKGIMTVREPKAAENTESKSTVLYRIDKDEFSNGLALIRNNLVTLMSSHPMHTKLREQIVFDSIPTFSDSSLPALPPTQLGQMNDDQQAAVSKVMNAQDYALILGMPGTGKTTTIAHIIRALLTEEKTILLTSFTHTAVDNILLKIKDIAPPNSVLRLGVPAKINPEVQKFCQLAATPRKTADEIDEVYMGSKIVATTCMGTNHTLFNRRSFDVCIVDEASQITLPTSLGPLLHARRFVLVGDHFQLPPLVQTRAALEGGLDVSLFKQLSEQHPQAVAALGRQYRMCEDIMTLSNELIYGGKLRCGNEEVASRKLHITNPSGLQTLHGSSSICSDSATPCWLYDLTSPARSVVFASTDLCGKSALETLSPGSKNITNSLEATLTLQLVLSLIAQDVPARDIGVITLYRSQLSLLRRLFKLASVPAEVEIDSADRFQGRDKECVIVSMVRANEAGVVGDLLKDWRRVNVALTRARSKLVVLGHRATLGKNELLAKFLRLVDQRAWAVALPSGVGKLHEIGCASQANGGRNEEAIGQADTLTNSPAESGSGSSTKLSGRSPSKVLKSSASAANRSPLKASVAGIVKQPGKVVKGGKVKGRKMMEQLAIEIFEDDFAADDDF